ncbi:hypothetical protein C21_01808 [Arenibacter sp. NBRC 103722]|uniref:DUF1569 domain-containing protein n=1 Tax=Arenibacter sp. NBRC 103722 TaxID=1113929 RepID=UPI0008539A36|nr:DUF1569 domain-containing protein [Arenibacter sp. NBRC 103722]GBF19639.1 hypothetical protein C21_01808 [Arenibacter sp. NBRC 103722]
MKNIFDKKVVDEVVGRINKLTPKSAGLWGKMNVAQMMAHCNVSYEMVYTDKHPKPNGAMKLMLKLFVKQPVVNEKPYKKNSRTAPAFLIVDERDFEKEKQRLIDYLIKTQELGEDHFHNKESHSFGPLTKTEWNNLSYKHLNHHLEQFGV